MSLLQEWKTLIKTRDPCVWIDANIHRNELNQPFHLYPHQRVILSTCFPFNTDGRLPYDTILYSAPKKSGKTSVLALLALYWGMTQEAPNEILLIANDLEQAQSRAYATIQKLLRYNLDIDRGASISGKEINLSNGSVIKPIASEYSGAAGSNHGFCSLDELWAYTSERSRRLYEELTSVPTRLNSIKIITIYAGFENESFLLHGLYKLGVSTEEHLEGKAERIHSELPIYRNQEARLITYWDHEPRFPWQTPTYYSSQKRSLRPSAYLRFHQNKWSTSEEVFITPELWDPCVDYSHRPLLPTQEYPLFIGVDGSIKHDSSAIVGVRWDGDQLALAYHRIWQPTAEQPLDLEATLEAELRYLHQHYKIQVIRYDPYQLHRSMSGLRNEGLACEEFPQTSGNCTQMGQSMFDLLMGRNIRLYPSNELRAQALNTVSVESTRGWKISKDKSSKKIDAVVALAMACVAALDQGNVQAVDIDPDEIDRILAAAAREAADASSLSPQVTTMDSLEEFYALYGRNA